MKNMTIEKYAEYVSHMMKQAEEDGFYYELDMTHVRPSNFPIKENSSDDQNPR